MYISPRVLYTARILIVLKTKASLQELLQSANQFMEYAPSEVHTYAEKVARVAAQNLELETAAKQQKSDATLISCLTTKLDVCGRRLETGFRLLAVQCWAIHHAGHPDEKLKDAGVEGTLAKAYNQVRVCVHVHGSYLDGIVIHFRATRSTSS